MGSAFSSTEKGDSNFVRSRQSLKNHLTKQQNIANMKAKAKKIDTNSTTPKDKNKK
jgi:hypothetical protein